MNYFKGKGKLIRNALLAITLIVIVFLVIRRFSINMDVERIRVFVDSFGVFAPIIYIIIYTSTIVFSPIAGLPFIFAGLIIFEFWQIVIYYTIALLLGASINFYIGRRFGRPLIKKFIGKKGIEKVDEFTEITGWQGVLIMRLFVASFFDYVSYAIGLTSMKFRTYFLVTLLGGVPLSILNLYIFNRVLNVYGNAYGFTFIMVFGYVFAFISLPLFYLIKKKRMKNKVFKNVPDKL